jgi:hypothetical protein
VTDFDTPKSEWGEGPWRQESDREDFEYAGFACLALRNPSGYWCGYVGVPEGHPAYDMDPDEVNVAVHGGLTYGGKEPICHQSKPGYREHVYWLGFDCAHIWDYAPGISAFLRRLGIAHDRLPGQVYRDLAYVRGEIESLAEQLAAMPARRCDYK